MTPYNATIYDGSWTPVLQGKFNRQLRSYSIPLEQSMTVPSYITTDPTDTTHPHTAKSAYQSKDVPALIQFHHASAGFPTTGAWKAAVKKGYYIGWPGLTTDRITKHHVKSPHTVKGHQQLTRQHTRTTNPAKGPRSRSHSICVEIEENNQKPDLTNRIASDQTGRYPITSGKATNTS